MSNIVVLDPLNLKPSTMPLKLVARDENSQKSIVNNRHDTVNTEIRHIRN